MFIVKRMCLFSAMLTLISLISFAANLSHIYSRDEITFIEKLQSSEVRIGVDSESIYFDREDPDDSLAYKYEALLEELLYIDVEVVADHGETLYRMLEDEEIDLLLNFPISSEQKKEFHFSNPIYTQKLCLLAPGEDLTLNHLKYLEGREVAVLTSSDHIKHLEEFKRERNLNYKIIEMRDATKREELYYIVLPEEDTYDKTSPTFKLGWTDPTGLGIVKSKPMLKSIIDKALDFSHREKLLELLEYEKRKRKRRAFHSLLTPKEISYLNSKKKIEDKLSGGSLSGIFL